MTELSLQVVPLTREAFAEFGDVIEAGAAKTLYPVNSGTATRYHDLAEVDTAQQGGRTVVSIFRSQPRELPFAVTMLERHPLGSQAFVPLGDARYIVVVAPDPQSPPRAFLAQGQGINYRPGTWHHPLIALDRLSDFLVIDRAGPGANCDEAALPQPYRIDCE
jgi:ureidoglycolate lyase